ncbi:MAG: ChbG/HpnK family deacetylase [Bacteroidetes bacterium]|nr:ChbG/HpnK family deacetylase [Bacteroidota bacterium]
MTKILIIADDLGIDSLTNERITDCYEKGLISSTSVMVTMPGFEEAVQWYKRQGQEPKLEFTLIYGGKPVSEAFLRTAEGNKKTFRSRRTINRDRKYLETSNKNLMYRPKTHQFRNRFVSHRFRSSKIPIVLL